MNFLEEAEARGFIHQCTDLVALTEAMQSPIKAYIGFDCTANSLHVGSLMQLMILRLLQKHGHHPIIVMGGATTKIGDPSGKDASRKMLTASEVYDNTAGIKACIEPFLNWKSAKMVNNADWFQDAYFLNILRDIGPHFSVNRMLTMDSVKTRLEKEDHMTFLEFNYIIMQSYDFRELNRKHDVILQIGGSDQWGNITAGIELVRRTDKKNVFGLTTPLIETSSGQKMGKSEGNAIWLSKSKTSVFDFWQFWRNTDDKDVDRFLRLFTELPLDEIEKFELANDAVSINKAKVILATEATSITHGRDAAKKAEDQAAAVFDFDMPIGRDLITFRVSEKDIEDGISPVLLLNQVGFATSKSDARRLIQGKGVRINDIIIAEDKLVLIDDFTSGALKLSVGQKRHKFIGIENDKPSL